MVEEIITFCNIEIEINKFYNHESCIFLKDADILKVLGSSAEKSCKYFIGYLHDHYKVKPLHIILPNTSAYVMMEKLNRCMF